MQLWRKNNRRRKMKLHIVTDEGELIDSIEELEKIDFGKPVARSVILDELREIIERGLKMEKENEEE